jgi:N-hydroxyarylamine O-acetyltransferase
MTWDIEKVDLDAYLARIGHGRVTPSVEALHTLHEAHVRTIPFENVDVVLGTHPGIGLDVITTKLVDRRRGGYCYEHALLFAAVLEQLGFTVQRRVARVQPHKNGPRTHMLLTVEVDGQKFLADVGFGAGVLHPMPLVDGAIVDQAGWPHRLTFAEGAWTLSKQTAEGWEQLHRHDDQPQRPLDYEVYHHYVSTHPDSPFIRKLVVMRLDHGVSRRLVGDELTIDHADGRTASRVVPAPQLDAVLRELDVILTPAELRGVSERKLSPSSSPTRK